VTTAGLLVGGGLAATSAQAVDTPQPTISVSQAAAKATQATTEPTSKTQRQAARQAVRDEVVERALSRVGSAYSAGAEGPRAFDCSGLTLFAWRAAGVDLTHYSYAQSQETKKISIKKALPGDLVFYFRNGARHVGLYVGKGLMVHASDYGVGVIKSPILGTAWTDTHFSGIGRVKFAA
jgi:cell wall-associated NlpC family hydrolase